MDVRAGSECSGVTVTRMLWEHLGSSPCQQRDRHVFLHLACLFDVFQSNESMVSIPEAQFVLLYKINSKYGHLSKNATSRHGDMDLHR